MTRLSERHQDDGEDDGGTLSAVISAGLPASPADGRFRAFPQFPIPQVILALVLSFGMRAEAVAVTPADQAAAFHFCQALTSARIRSFLPLASDSDGLSGDAWSSVRGFFTRYDCISISSYRTRRESEWL